MDWPYWFCKLFGHRVPTLLFQKGNEECDCGADHTYFGCSRCRQYLEN